MGSIVDLSKKCLTSKIKLLNIVLQYALDILIQWSDYWPKWYIYHVIVQVIGSPAVPRVLGPVERPAWLEGGGVDKPARFITRLLLGFASASEIAVQGGVHPLRSPLLQHLPDYCTQVWSKYSSWYSMSLNLLAIDFSAKHCLQESLALPCMQEKDKAWWCHQDFPVIFYHRFWVIDLHVCMHFQFPHHIVLPNL